MKIAALALLVPVSITTTASAQFAVQSDAPIDITGDTAELLNDVAVFIGNVRAVQDDSILVADRLEAKISDDGNFSSITATGSVRYSNGKEAITGKHLYFDNEARTITITDDVIVTQGKQVMSAGAVTFWIDTGKVKFKPAEGRRIRGIFYAEGDEQT